MKEEQWKDYFIPYEQAVEELMVKFQNLSHQFRMKKIHSPIELVFGRVKNINSIINKAKRYGIQKIDEKIGEYIKDIAGIRIISQFEDDIDAVVAMIEQRTDLTIVEKRDYIRNPKSSGYRSYHVIAEYEVITAFGTRKIYVEIQLRTMAMNFWATIEHSLTYKYAGNIPAYIDERLQQAAIASAKLDNEMFQIREEVKQAQTYYSIYREIRNLIQVIHSLGKANSHKELIEKAHRFMSETKEIEKLQNVKNELICAIGNDKVLMEGDYI